MPIIVQINAKRSNRIRIAIDARQQCCRWWFAATCVFTFWFRFIDFVFDANPFVQCHSTNKFGKLSRFSLIYNNWMFNIDDIVWKWSRFERSVITISKCPVRRLFAQATNGQCWQLYDLGYDRLGNTLWTVPGPVPVENSLSSRSIKSELTHLNRGPKDIFIRSAPRHSRSCYAFQPSAMRRWGDDSSLHRRSQSQFCPFSTTARIVMWLWLWFDIENRSRFLIK